MPKVSVVIPAYNHNAYVRQCVDSVLAQTYQEYEIIVVDDGSSDGTLDVLRAYGDAITLVEQPNSGTQAARNAGIGRSSGQFIAILDSDDVWLPRKLERQMAVFDAFPEAGLVYSFAFTIDGDGKHLNKGATFGEPVTDPGKAFSQLLLGDIIPALTAVFRRSCTDEVGLFDETLLGSGDWDLWLRIAARWPVVCVPEPLALYRIHDTNTTKLLFRNRTVYEEHERVLQKAFELNPMEPVGATLRNRALARTHLYGAQVEAMAGDASSCGQELAKALELDPALAHDADSLVGRIVDLAHRYCGVDRRGAMYREFTRDLFFELEQSLPALSHLRREVLSTATMGAVFSMRPSGEQAAIRSLLPVAIAANPRWLLNLGVWSILADALMGQRLSAALRKVLRNLRAMTP